MRRFVFKAALLIPLQLRSLNSLSWLGGSSAFAIVLAMILIITDVVKTDADKEANHTMAHTDTGPPAGSTFLQV